MIIKIGQSAKAATNAKNHKAKEQQATRPTTATDLSKNTTKATEAHKLTGTTTKKTKQQPRHFQQQ